MNNSFTIEDVREFWDKISHKYEPVNQRIGYAHSQRFEKAIEYSDIAPGMEILNIWSRTGNLIPYLRQAGEVGIHNLEASPSMLALARIKYPEEKFSLTDLEKLSEYPDNFFDRVISLETLEHVPKPGVFVSELHRVLKPGGKLVMSTPPAGTELPLRLYELIFENHGEGPHKFLWPSQIKTILAEVGFTKSEHKPGVMLPFKNDSLARKSEKILTKLFGKTPLANFSIRHFYIAQKQDESI